MKKEAVLKEFQNQEYAVIPGFLSPAPAQIAYAPEHYKKDIPGYYPKITKEDLKNKVLR